MALNTILVTLSSEDIVVAVDSDYPAGTQWFLGIEGPYGDIKVIDLESPDDTAQSPEITVALEDPLDDGNYIFTLTLYPDGEENDAVTVTKTFCLSRDTELTVTVTDDCEELTVEDETSYPTIVAMNRSHTIRYPIIPGVTATDDLIATSARVVLNMVQSDGLIYEFVTWTVVTDVTGIFSHESGIWTFNYPIAYTQSVVNYEVRCNLDLCGAIACVDNAWLSLMADACTRGGITKLPVGQQEKIQTLLGHMAMYSYWVQCGNAAKTREYYDKIVALTSVNCSPDTSPKPITTSVAVGLGWTQFPEDAYVNGYAQVLGSELSWRLEGRSMYFKGAVDGNAFSSTGLNMIDPSYFTDLGITLAAGVRIPIMDVATSDVEGCVGFLVVASNGLDIYAANNINAAHNFAIGGTLLIE